MSLAIRKRSWEEHVTQWMGLPFGSIDSNILCRHGLVADNLPASMENDGVRSSGQKETSASLPDCCHGGELVGFPLKLLGNVSKEVDENDNHQEEEDLLSLEASTETLVSVSVGGDGEDGGGEGEFSLERANHHSAQVEEELSDGSSRVETAQPFRDTEAENELDHAYLSSRKANEPQYDTVPQMVTVETSPCDRRGESLELYRDSSSSENDLGENSSQSQEHIVSEEQDQYNRAALATDSNDYLLPLPGSPLLPEDNDLDGFADSQDKLVTSVPLVEGGTDLKNSMATREATDSQVILRKRKEAREGRDQSRLDSMVLLILKLDQLDQDIENALSSGSSPSSTPTHPRRHIHILSLK
ncbi:PREDICTED: rho GTPase-activating protein 7 [Gekko japonicus]|uniref:Rho GTPase-activating protein 7 n=1 Tax=Gekko japonicus TaxID=146911 RepID=A0ABM1L768_GEKJA|nr:PREDICTED: rho GTPase-activating protein 7 [Gekko japonicus]